MLNCRSNNLTVIDVSNNTLLEEIYINVQDLYPWNLINEIDLSNNPNINYAEAIHIPTLHTINLKNGNNPDMDIIIGFDIWEEPFPQDPLSTVCIQVDNEELAQSNQLPYSEWNILSPFAEYNFSENCTLSTIGFDKNNVQLSVYPNPASDNLHITSSENTTDITVYNMLGQKVKQVKVNSNESTIDVSNLTSGTYFILANTANGSVTEKIIIK